MDVLFKIRITKRIVIQSITSKQTEKIQVDKNNF